METTEIDTDLPWLTYEGQKTLERGYLLEGETPLNMYQRVAKASAERLKKPAMAPIFLEAMRRNWLCLASPVAANLGSSRGFPISCFGLTVSDSVDGIFKSAWELAMLSKMGGGVGIQLSDIRGRGTNITGNGVSEGIIPWTKVYDSTIISVNQGQTRRGAGSVNLNIQHRDAAEFLQMRRPVGDINRQCLNLNHCFQVGDEFMQSLEEGNPVNRLLWENTLRTRLETGEPYIMFQDTVNRDLPDAYLKNGLDVKMTNICSEITLHSDSNHTFVCCLSSLNLARWDEWKDFTFSNGMTLPQLAVWFLDGVIQEFIDKAERYPGFEHAVAFAKKSRALGVGVLGWHTYLQQHDLPFDTSVEVMGLNAQMFSFIRKETIRGSTGLCVEYNEPEWCRNTGMRNTHLMALAPTVSNSMISGNLSPSIEPIVANAYTPKTAKGTFPYRNPVLLPVLEKYRKNNRDTWQSIVANEGSVQQLDFLTEHEREVFLTAREMPQFALIQQAAQRQKYIDQSQSLNLFIPRGVAKTPEGAKWFHNLHMEAWRLGVKTLYYVRSQSELKADQVSRVIDMDCVACEG